MYLRGSCYVVRKGSGSKKWWGEDCEDFEIIFALVAQAVLHAHRYRDNLASGKCCFLILQGEDACARKSVNRLNFVGMDVDADHAARRKAQESNAGKGVVSALDQGFEINAGITWMRFPGDVGVVGDWWGQVVGFGHNVFCSLVVALISRSVVCRNTNLIPVHDRPFSSYMLKFNFRNPKTEVFTETPLKIGRICLIRGIIRRVMANSC